MKAEKGIKKNELILSFCIWKFDDITHAEITKAFNVQPSKVYIKGQQKNKATELSKHNSWIYNPCQDVYATYNNEPVDAIVNFLNGLSDEAKAICKNHYCEVSCAIFIYKDNGESTPWIHLTKEYTKIAHELGIEFDLDLYVL